EGERKDRRLADEHLVLTVERRQVLLRDPPHVALGQVLLDEGLRDAEVVVPGLQHYGDIVEMRGDPLVVVDLIRGGDQEGYGHGRHSLGDTSLSVPARPEG